MKPKKRGGGGPKFESGFVCFLGWGAQDSIFWHNIHPCDYKIKNHTIYNTIKYYNVLRVFSTFLWTTYLPSPLFSSGFEKISPTGGMLVLSHQMLGEPRELRQLQTGSMSSSHSSTRYFTSCVTRLLLSLDI